MGNKKELSPEQREELLGALKGRFAKNMNRHQGLAWAKVQAKLEATALTHPLYQKAFDIWYQYVSFHAATCPDRELRKNAAITSLYAEQMLNLAVSPNRGRVFIPRSSSRSTTPGARADARSSWPTCRTRWAPRRSRG